MSPPSPVRGMVVEMDETADLGEDIKTVALLKDLQRMRGSRCEECAALLCGHETLMSFVAGCKDAPRCLPCLARLMERGREELRDHLFRYIMSHTCRRAGWLWATQEEGTESTTLPGCLWPPNGVAQEQVKEVPLVMSPDHPDFDSLPDAEWDAGNTGCGELVMGLRMQLQLLKGGQILKLTATDPGVPEDLPAWCRLTGHKLLYSNHPDYWIQRKEN